MTGGTTDAGGEAALTLRTKTDVTDMPMLEVPRTDAFSIVALVGGACRIESRAGRGWCKAIFTAGDVGITVPGRAVALRWRLLGDQPKRTVHIGLPMAAFDRYLAEESGPSPDLRRLDVLATPDPVITAMAASLVKARAAGAGALHADCAAQYLVAHLLSPKSTEEPELRVLGERQLGVAIEYMRANLAGRITLEDLAREVALSRFHFLRLFSATTGRSPVRYLTELRIETARRQLSGTAEPIGRIGRQCGFPSASHFAATFAKHVGCTPTEYRIRP